jgi:hypothetical protein
VSRLLIVFIFLNFLGVRSAYSQNFFENADSLHKPRLIVVSSAIGVGWTTSMIGLHYVWYNEYPKSKFHLFDDSKEWMQMDKMGHFFTAYQISDKIAGTFRWSGLDRNVSSFIGAGVGFGYQLTLEFLDATNSQWGFSWSDVGANAAGTALFLGQELAFQEQIFKPKFSFSPSKYAKYRPNTLGANIAEQLLKDYNGQTYWISFSPFAFSRDESLPKWLCFSIGYSVDAKIHGYDNTYAVGNEIFQARRQWVFSLDIDVSKFHFKRKWPKVLLSPFNMIKIPFPAIIFTKDDVQGSWLYF